MQKLNKNILLILTCYLAAVSINYAASKAYPAKIYDDVRFVPARIIVDFLSLDHKGFVADYLFTKVVLHSGSLMWKPLEIDFDSRWSFKMMDLVTDLDPDFLTAYIFTGAGLIHYPADVDLSRPVMEKGIKHLPASWEIPFWLGYDYYIYKEDFANASRYFMLAGQHTDSPKRFLALLLTASKRSGIYQNACWAMQAMLENSENKELKLLYSKKLAQFKNLLNLTKAVQVFQTNFNRFPDNLAELVDMEIITKLPMDPFGSTYFWDIKISRVVIQKRKGSN